MRLPLRVRRGCAALRATPIQAHNLIGTLQQCGKRLEHLPEVIEVAAAHDDDSRRSKKLRKHGDQLRSEKVHFVNREDLHSTCQRHHVRSTLYGSRFESSAGVRRDFISCRSTIPRRLKDDDAPLRRSRERNPADELRCLAGKHRSADHFKPTTHDRGSVMRNIRDDFVIGSTTQSPGSSAG